jgi:hypothetical protein
MDRRRVLASVAALGLLPGVTKAQDENLDLYYIGSVVALVRMLEWFFNVEEELVSNYTEDQFTDESWRVDILGPFSIPRAAQQVILEVTPPAAYQESYDYLREAIDAAVEAGWAMSDGILEGDTAAFTSMSENMQRSKDLIDQATAAIPGN